VQKKAKGSISAVNEDCDAAAAGSLKSCLQTNRRTKRPRASAPYRKAELSVMRQAANKRRKAAEGETVAGEGGRGRTGEPDGGRNLPPTDYCGMAAHHATGARARCTVFGGK